MLSKINETVIAVVSAIFVLAGIWNFALPISQGDALEIWQYFVGFLSLIGVFGGGVVATIKSIQKQIKKQGYAVFRFGTLK